MAPWYSATALCLAALLALDGNHGQANAQYYQTFTPLRLTNPVTNAIYDAFA